MTVVNFAHGAFYMLSAYVGFFILGLTGSFWLGLVIVPLVLARWA
jgi:branched-chain amino acid transport system permease protein